VRQLRFDVYYGYSDEGGPIDRIQFCYAVDEDTEEIGDDIKQQVVCAIEELREGNDEDDE
jgi:hypothetical protein